MLSESNISYLSIFLTLLSVSAKATSKILEH